MFKKKEVKRKAYPHSLNNVIQIDEVTGYPFSPKQVAEEFIEHCLNSRYSERYAYEHALWLAELYECQVFKRNQWYWRHVARFIKEMTPEWEPKKYKTIIDK